MVEAVGLEPTQLLGDRFTDGGAQPMLSTSLIYNSYCVYAPFQTEILRTHYIYINMSYIM